LTGVSILPETTDVLNRDSTFEDSYNEVPIDQTFHTLWLKKHIVIRVTLLITLIASFIIFQLVPQYTASTQLLLGIHTAKVVNIEEVISGSLSGDSAVVGEIEVIKSRDLARAVIKKLNLQQYQEFNQELKPPSLSSNITNFFESSELLQSMGVIKKDNLSDEDKQQRLYTRMIDIFLTKLKVEQVKKSQVVTITYTSESANLAAKIANEIADQYIIGQMQAKFDATKKATDWLNDQLADLKIKVEAADHAVEEYRKTYGLLEVGKDQGLSQQQLSEINSQLILARSQTAQALAKYNQVSTLLTNGSERDIDSVSEVLNSLLIQNLRQQEAEVQRQYSEMLVEYGEKHPRMIQMQAKLLDINNKIKGEIKKIAAGLRNSLEVARSNESSLSSSLKQIETKSGFNSQHEVQLRALEREANANRTLFENFLSRFKETTTTQGIEQADARVISLAETPRIQAFPNKTLFFCVSAISGLFFSILLVFALEILNQGLRSPEQIQDVLKIPTLGIVPKSIHKSITPAQYLLDKPQSGLAEAINNLRVSLSLLNPDAKIKTLLITSSVPGEGKSTLSALIGRQAAKTGQRILLVDTDFRRPAIEKMLNLDPNQPGLSNLLANPELAISDVLINDQETGLKILTHGQIKIANPTDVFASKRMIAILDELKTDFDLIILDSPPLMAVPDARVLSGMVDKVVMVVAWDKTPRKVARSALQLLKREGHQNIAGVVLQQIDLNKYSSFDYSNSGYYYHYSRYGNYYSG
jgi:capsular exopolysaccharide synthesis family protein